MTTLSELPTSAICSTLFVNESQFNLVPNPVYAFWEIVLNPRRVPKETDFIMNAYSDFLRSASIYNFEYFWSFNMTSAVDIELNYDASILIVPS